MANNLIKYNQKRNFDKTSEPHGRKHKTNKQLIFVVQHHIATRDHFDLRLEFNGVLLSWAIPQGPSFNPTDKRLAAHVENHPFDYRNFEGNIPKGQYGGGTVMIWDEGYYIPEVDMKKGLESGTLKFTLYGERLKGSWALIKMKNDKKADYWLLIKHNDEYAKKTSGIKKFTRSIRTNRTMKEIESGAKKSTKNPFSKADVQLAKLSNHVPEGEDWVYEVKYDGYRILSYVENDSARLVSRNDNNYNKYFNEISSSLVDLADGRSMVLDGEVVVIDKSGKTDFSSLQSHVKSQNKQNLRYMIFDLLALDGKDLRKKSLIERKEILKKLLNNKSNLIYSEHVVGNGQQNFQAVANAGLEGMICKKGNSTYSGSRNGDWVKVKSESRQEFIICGYILSKKVKGAIQSLVLGYYNNKDLVYAGRVGSGLDNHTMDELIRILEPIRRKTSSFVSLNSVKDAKSVIWVLPKYVSEIKFTEWTKDNILRHPSFKGLRIDKKTKEIVNETEAIKKTSKSKSSEIIISNKDKIMFEGTKITKNDVADYYKSVSKRMLPYIENHLLSLIVCPSGTKGESFFKKHPINSNNISIYKLNDSENKKDDYFFINHEIGLIQQVQMNAIEFHIWGSSVKNIERPDVIVFDLDPDEGMDLKQIRQGAKDLKKILTTLNLNSFIKTSGGKGYHILVPLKPKGNWDSVRTFCKNIALLMEEKWPNRYTSNVRKNKRKNKMFIDWMRNIKGATSVAPYSLRARKNAPVSIPINWNELNKIAPNQITIADAITRLKKKDPWQDFFKIGLKQSIK